MGDVSNWIIGGLIIVMGIAALFVAAHTGHGVGYYGGLGIFLFSVLFVLHLMKVSFDKRDRAPHDKLPGHDKFPGHNT